MDRFEVLWIETSAGGFKKKSSADDDEYPGEIV